MRVHVLQHVPFEGLGSIQTWLTAKEANVTTTRFFESPILPDLSAIDVLIALGGPMSVNDETNLPWLVEEKRFIAQAVQAELPVLGICLGAQLIASAMNARVYPGANKEIGWFPVSACALQADSFAFPGRINVFHWHGETFDLPSTSKHLAVSEGCVNQAFQIGRRAIGLQFHLETTPESIDLMISNCRNELVSGTFIQSEPEIRAAPNERFAEINDLMASILGYITGPYTAPSRKAYPSSKVKPVR
ncbi:MAG: type 1 glutamine amidotransferase [Gammaproteobacteria bacterium]